MVTLYQPHAHRNSTLTFIQRVSRTVDFAHLECLSREILSKIFVISILACVLLCIPQEAYARKTYRMEQVDIQASIDPSGDLHIQETRSFKFKGSFHGVYWKLPYGEYEGRHLEPQDIQAFQYRGDVPQAFVQDGREHDGSFQVIDDGSTKQVKLYSSQSNNTARFGISYTIPQACFRYEDVGVLYWKFVSDGWDKASHNVTCVLDFEDLLTKLRNTSVPAPADPDKDIMAWGHSASAAALAVKDSKVVCKLDEVASSDFAEMRVIFPSAWLSTAPLIQGSKKDEIQNEERSFQEAALHEIYQARMIIQAFWAIYMQVKWMLRIILLPQL